MSTSASGNRTRRAATPSAEAASVAAVAGLFALATVAGAWLFQVAGYVPCELCLRERIPYYVGIVAAAIVFGAARSRRVDIVLAGFTAMIVVFSAGAALGAYHAGVEWDFWPGPEACSGAFGTPAKASDFFNALGTVAVVRCDRPALLVLGLSLAAWNAAIAAGLTGLSLFGVTRAAGAEWA